MDPVSELSSTAQEWTQSTQLSSMSNSCQRIGAKVSEKSLIDSMIVLLNSNDLNDDYIQEIQLKCSESCHKVLSFTPIEFTFVNIQHLFEALIRVHNWSAICLSSKRCIDALVMAINYNKSYDLSDLWLKSNNKVFVVGIKSYLYLKDRLNWEGIGSDCGNGDNLAKLMINDFKTQLSGKAVLFPCSQSRSDCLPQTLTNAGIAVKEIAVYQTIANKRLNESFNQLNNYLIHCLEERDVESPMKLIFVFFSPSGLKSVLPFLMDYIIENNKISDKLVVKYVAIGSTTGAAIVQSGLDVWFTSPKPNPKSLAQALSENISLIMKVKTVLRQTLEGWLNKNMKILMSDGRTLVGVFLCTDRDRNVILGSCLEYLKPNEGTTEEPRVLGLAMIPGQHIVSIHVDSSSLKH